jgi:hypothetical protein
LKNRNRKIKIDTGFLVTSVVVDELDRRYRTEEDYFKAIWNRIRKFKRCQFCNCGRLKFLLGRRVAECRNCGKQNWLTAGTLFERMREPRAYFVAITLAERKVPFNARTLSRLCKIAYATASAIFKKVMAVMLEAMVGKTEKVSSFELDEIICKRSIETHARKHPVTEQEEQLVPPAQISFDPLQAHSESQSTVQCASGDLTNTDTLHESGVVTPTGVITTTERVGVKNVVPVAPEEIIFSLLSNEPQSIDSLAAATGLEPARVRAGITILELADLVRRLPGDRVVLAVHILKACLIPMTPRVELSVRRTVRVIKKLFHGVSRKYLQLYLAAVWCFLKPARWAENELFNLCCQTPAIKIARYKSPLEVQLWAS